MSELVLRFLFIQKKKKKEKKLPDAWSCFPLCVCELTLRRWYFTVWTFRPHFYLLIDLPLQLSVHPRHDALFLTSTYHVTLMWHIPVVASLWYFSFLFFITLLLLFSVILQKFYFTTEWKSAKADSMLWCTVSRCYVLSNLTRTLWYPALNLQSPPP